MVPELDDPGIPTIYPIRNFTNQETNWLRWICLLSACVFLLGSLAVLAFVLFRLW